MSANDVAVTLGRYKDKTIAELVNALADFRIDDGHFVGCLRYYSHVHFQVYEPCDSRCRSANAALARARTDLSWQRYSRDNQEQPDLAE